MDAAGRVELRLAGHPVRVRTGVAALALETGAPILPAVVLRRGWRQHGLLFEPVDPAGFSDSAALTQHVFDVLGPSLAAEPEQADLNFLRLRDFAGRVDKQRDGQQQLRQRRAQGRTVE